MKCPVCGHNLILIEKKDKKMVFCANCGFGEYINDSGNRKTIDMHVPEDFVNSVGIGRIIRATGKILAALTDGEDPFELLDELFDE